MIKANQSVRKAVLLTTLLGFLSVVFPVALQAQPLTGWQLVWFDEFNGTSVDASKWGLELNEGNPGVAVFTNRSQNLFVSNGCLVLQALKESYNGKQYTTTQISTRGKGEWLYCRIDVRAQLASGQGMWPAIWMMPAQQVYGPWPASGEIDNMEHLGNEPRSIHTTLHHSTTNVGIGYMYNLPAGAKAFADTFHVFTMIWDTGSFRWYIDNGNYSTMNQWSPDNVAYPKPFDLAAFLMFDLAVGGWAGTPDPNLVFPKQMLVDWVRVYKRQGPTQTLHPAPSRRAESDVLLTVSGNILRYDLKKGGRIGVALYDGLGRRVISLVNDCRLAGSYNLDLAACRVRPGFYLCTFENGIKKELKKIVVK
jgi:beta-glucanase (GH16 family)